MVNINVVFDFRLKKLGDGWVGGGWVVFTEIKDRFEPINITLYSMIQDSIYDVKPKENFQL